MYLQYVRLMEHWDTVLPGRVLTMRYEAVVDDTQQQIAQMLKHCGLEWEVACLDFRSTSRTFSTASSEQVRQPIYTSSIGYWRHYEENLTDLIESLESVIAGSQTDAV
jgi:UDP-N-acetylglucosamine transferase subunit ALG13